MKRTEVILIRQVVLVLVWILVAGSETMDSGESDGRKFGEVNSEMSTKESKPSQQLLTNDNNGGKTVDISSDEQKVILGLYRELCYSKASPANSVRVELTSDIVPSTAEVSDGAAHAQSCERVWDEISCWPETPAGQLAVQPCPSYVHNFNAEGNASRQCDKDGRWFFQPFNRSWTNYSDCLMPPGTVEYPPIFQGHVPRIRLIYYIGYSLSLVVLLVAVATMMSLKKLRCPRNLLHINLFFSFILRALLALSRDVLMSEGVSMSSDIKRHEDGSLVFDEEDSHWQCRLLMASFNFAMVANHAWIFIEGLYLHTLLFVTIFSESSSVLPYIVFGWVLPFTAVSVWSFVRLTLDNVFCWNTHTYPGFFWIIKGPGFAMVIANFCFFLNIVRVLFTKLRAFNAPDSKRYRHMKLVKSALVLIPLFGVPYICFVVTPDNAGDLAELVKLYFEMTFNSFNGVIIAVLYCFFNGEVQSEIRKKWQRYRAGNVCGDRSRRTTLTSNLFPSRYGHHHSLRSGGNSSVGLDHEDQLGGVGGGGGGGPPGNTVYEVTVSTKCGEGNAAASAGERGVLGGQRDRRGSSSNGSWMSESSSAIPMKTLNDGGGGGGGGGGRKQARKRDACPLGGSEDEGGSETPPPPSPNESRTRRQSSSNQNNHRSLIIVINDRSF